MIQVASFTYNVFEENTYILFDETKECIIIAPGCTNQTERDNLKKFIDTNMLKPVRLINTHCHLDHIFGNKWVYVTYGLLPEIHEGEWQVLQAAPQVSMMYGVRCDVSPSPVRFISDGDIVRFGNSALKSILAPGHSPASLCFYAENEKFLIGGDVLFYESIGRTDLPGGDYDTLIHSIQNRLMTLPDDIEVHSGHGPSTTIGHERRYNPFINEH